MKPCVCVCIILNDVRFQPAGPKRKSETELHQRAKSFLLWEQLGASWVTCTVVFGLCASWCLSDVC